MEVELFLRVIVHLEPLLSVLVAPAFHHRQGSIDRVYAVLKIVDRQLKPSHKKEANGKPVGHDDNVHPQNSWHFIDELVKENIQFEMMFYPMRKHGIADDEARIHLYTKMLSFWELNL